MALEIEVWKRFLTGTVRDGDDVSRLVDTALQLALIAARIGVGILRVQACWLSAIPSLTECAVGAITAVNGIEESWNDQIISQLEVENLMLTIPEAIEVSSRFIKFVVFLEENELLGVDQRLRRVEIQWSLEINRHKLRGVFDSPDSAIYQTLFRISAIRNITARC